MECDNFQLHFLKCNKQESKLKSTVNMFWVDKFFLLTPHLGNKLQSYQYRTKAFIHFDRIMIDIYVYPYFLRPAIQYHSTNFILFLINHTFCTTPWLMFYTIRKELSFDLFFKFLYPSTVLHRRNMSLWR